MKNKVYIKKIVKLKKRKGDYAREFPHNFSKLVETNSTKCETTGF